MKTLNERVKDVVRTVVLDADYTELGEQSKAVQDYIAALFLIPQFLRVPKLGALCYILFFQRMKILKTV